MTEKKIAKLVREECKKWTGQPAIYARHPVLLRLPTHSRARHRRGFPIAKSHPVTRLPNMTPNPMTSNNESEGRARAGRGYQFVRVGDVIRDEDQYFDAGDKAWKPTTNQSNDCHHARMYRRPSEATLIAKRMRGFEPPLASPTGTP